MNAVKCAQSTFNQHSCYSDARRQSKTPVSLLRRASEVSRKPQMSLIWFGKQMNSHRWQIDPARVSVSVWDVQKVMNL